MTQNEPGWVAVRRSHIDNMLDQHMETDEDRAAKAKVRARPTRKVPYYTASHTNPRITLHLNKNREALRQTNFYREVRPHERYLIIQPLI
jgi:hypothetical protein